MTYRPLQSTCLGFHPATVETAPSHPTKCTPKRALITGTSTKTTSIHLTDRCLSPSEIFLRILNTSSMYVPWIQVERERQVEHQEWSEHLWQVTVTNVSSVLRLTLTGWHGLGNGPGKNSSLSGQSQGILLWVRENRNFEEKSGKSDII